VNKSTDKYWLKMKIKDNMIDNWVLKCERLGEVKLFAYVLSTFNLNDNTWNYDSFKEKAISQLLGLNRSTIFNYLKSLCKNRLLIKKGKGLYEINSEYIEFGAKR